ncbi:MFS transporter [Streptomyces winkii]|uniref:MFS transporter n=1 Tax=Streptomyces winkii TaxID=3051178 RepID=UPI0028D3E848|nr:MFS transporter [Streptomyces sp. DSM 40971]
MSTDEAHQTRPVAPAPAKTQQTDPTPSREASRVLSATSIGNFLEWYDFAVYGFLAPQIGAAFFASGDQVTDLLATFAILGVAFVSRPFGGVLFGHFGDKLGRRGTLSAIILLMTVATAAVGLLPTQASIGLWAPVLLVVCRLAQGLSAGAEFNGASTFVVEHSPHNRRGLYASSIISTVGLGIACAAGVGVLLNAVLSPEAMQGWGWRVPFLISLPLGLSGLYMRLRLSETKAFKRAEESKQISRAPVLEALRTRPKAVLILFWAAAAQGVNYYMMLSYIPNHLQVNSGMSGTAALGTAAIAELVLAAFAPVVGIYLYRVGPPRMLLAGMVGFLLMNIPAFMLFEYGTWTTALLGQSLLALCEGLLVVAYTLVQVELFPARIRFSGSALAYGLAYVVFAGTAAFVATFLADKFETPYAAPVYAMTVTLIAIAVVASWLPREYRAAKRLEDALLTASEEVR